MNFYKKGSKYKNKKYEVDGIQFDSRKEGRRYMELKLLQKAGEISHLQLQPVFKLIPTQRVDGKVVERQCTYRGDFQYIDNNGKLVVEDVKGMKTEVYKIKKKLMLYQYGIQIKEV